MVFDVALPGAASHAAAGLFKEAWAGKKLVEHFQRGLPVLDQLYGLRHLNLTHDDGGTEDFLFVPPSAILEPNPVREHVTAAGDGWLEAGGVRHEGWVYIAAGVWCAQFHAGLHIAGKAGASLVFGGVHPGRIRSISRGRQAMAFERDGGTTYFSDGTAEVEYTDEHDRQTLERAASMGLTAAPLQRFWGRRPYTPGGPVFLQIGTRTWLATGGRKMGTIVGASFAKRLVDDELGS